MSSNVSGRLETEFQQIFHSKERGVSQASKELSFKKTGLQQWGQALVNFLTGQQTLSIREQQQDDHSVQWIVYDPSGHRRYVFNTEADVRTWIEQRYHQKGPQG